MPDMTVDTPQHDTAGQSGRWHNVGFEVLLEEPAVMTSPQSHRDQLQTLPHLPGSALRGALIARAQHTNDTDLAEALLGHGVQVTSAHLLVAVDGQLRRTFPAPKGWRTFPHTTEGFDTLAGEPEDGGAARKPNRLGGTAVVAVTSWGEAADPSSPIYAAVATPKTTRRIHIAQDRRRSRRSRRDDHTMFVVESLDSGQRFAGSINVADADTAQRIRTFLCSEPTVWLGKGKHAGYGGAAQLRALPLDEAPLLPDSTGEVAADVLWVVLRSEGVARDVRSGQPSAYAFTETVRATFERVIATHQHTEAAVTVEALAFEDTEVGGYNRTWRAPLPALPAMAAGSQMRLRVDGATVDARTLAALNGRPYGLRTADGCGSLLVAVCHSQHLLLRAAPAAADSNGAPPAPPSGAVFVLTAVAERQLTFERQQAAADTAATASSPPSPSLLGRLRHAASMSTDDTETLPRTAATADGRSCHAPAAPSAAETLRRTAATADGFADHAKEALKHCEVGDAGSLYDTVKAFAANANGDGDGPRGLGVTAKDLRCRTAELAGIDAGKLAGFDDGQAKSAADRMNAATLRRLFTELQRRSAAAAGTQERR